MRNAPLEHELKILLEARERLPRLAALLSGDTLRLQPEECDALSGWYAALCDDPGWPLLVSALDEPAAWPRTWELAREAGFSARTEHHNALVFSRLFFTALERDDLTLASHAWREALIAWTAADEGWLESHLQRCAPKSDAEAIAQTRQQALAPLIEALGERLRRALNADALIEAPDRRGLRFAHEAMEVCDTIIVSEESELATGARSLLESARQDIARTLTDALKARLDALQLTTVSAQGIVEIFEGFAQRTRYLENPIACDSAALRAGLNTLWELRRLERDEEIEASELILPALKPFAERLSESALDDHMELAGPLADYYTFEAEVAFSLTRREELLRQALAICEGHRNASRLLSFLMLERANRDLLKVAATPEFGAAIGPVRRRILDALERAQAAIAESHALYPSNELLADYRRDLAEELARFGLPGDSDA